MKNLKQILSKAITTKPDTCQFAKDRKYEESWIIPLHKPRPTKTMIDGYLRKDQFKTLIVEYIWDSLDDDNRFVFTFFFDKACRVQHPERQINHSLNFFYDYHDFNAFIEQFNDHIIGKTYLLTTPADSVDLGVFNNWLSVGPLTLWDKSDEYDSEIIKSKIESRPEIRKTTKNYQGLLFRFNTGRLLDGPYYGIKTPCCTKIGDEWTVDYGKIYYWMKLMLGI